MDGVALLDEAKAAGLTFVADGDRLVIRGPRAAEPVAERLVAHKPAVMAALAADGGIWWEDDNPEFLASILHLPPRGCIAPRMCARVGVCERHGAGQSCLVRQREGAS